jgi:hypothetical protein
MRKISIILVLLLSFQAISADKVTQGSVVPYDGVLLTDEQFIDAANAKRRLRLSDLKISQLEAQGELYEARHKIYQSELSKANSRANMAEFKTGIGMVLSFVVGATLMGFIAKETLK